MNLIVLEKYKGGILLKNLNSYDELLEKLIQQSLFVLYTTSPNCSVCHADFPVIQKIVTDNNLISYTVDVSQVPLVMGQLNLFSSPTVILFFKGKEVHRQARIIDFEELSFRIEQYKKINNLDHYNIGDNFL